MHNAVARKHKRSYHFSAYILVSHGLIVGMKVEYMDADESIKFAFIYPTHQRTKVLFATLFRDFYNFFPSDD